MSPTQCLADFQANHRHEAPQSRALALWSLASERDFVSRWLIETLDGMAAEHPLLPTGFAGPALQSLVMLDDGELHLSVAMIDAVQWQAASAAKQRGQAMVEFGDGWTHLRFLKADHVQAQRVHRRAETLSVDPPMEIGEGQEFHLVNNREALRLIDMGDDTLVLRLLVHDPDQHYAYEFDAENGALLRTRQARSHEARTQMTLSLLRSLGRKETLDRIAKGLPDWPAELRWHAVREALALDSRAGFALLERLISEDPEDRVRDLAEKTRASLVASHPELADKC